MFPGEGRLYFSSRYGESTLINFLLSELAYALRRITLYSDGCGSKVTTGLLFTRGMYTQVNSDSLMRSV